MKKVDGNRKFEMRIDSPFVVIPVRTAEADMWQMIATHWFLTYVASLEHFCFGSLGLNNTTADQQLCEQQTQQLDRVFQELQPETHTTSQIPGLRQRPIPAASSWDKLGKKNRYHVIATTEEDDEVEESASERLPDSARGNSGNNDQQHRQEKFSQADLAHSGNDDKKHRQKKLYEADWARSGNDDQKDSEKKLYGADSAHSGNSDQKHSDKHYEAALAYSGNEDQKHHQKKFYEADLARSGNDDQKDSEEKLYEADLARSGNDDQRHSEEAATTTRSTATSSTRRPWLTAATAKSNATRQTWLAEATTTRSSTRQTRLATTTSTAEKLHEADSAGSGNDEHKHSEEKLFEAALARSGNNDDHKHGGEQLYGADLTRSGHLHKHSEVKRDLAVFACSEDQAGFTRLQVKKYCFKRSDCHAFSDSSAGEEVVHGLDYEGEMDVSADSAAYLAAVRAEYEELRLAQLAVSTEQSPKPCVHSSPLSHFPFCQAAGAISANSSGFWHYRCS
eukprot:TRINITY_DN3878_c0_g1_i1.p1 TRINITY_DN3878_c0_g1~~TRINITY_DN3878_c0_g1_i1.p1  ORF type:complete len:507 (+),score=129.54 TRINITY_DN3878_c0_g1_i1:112-1632(+)